MSHRWSIRSKIAAMLVIPLLAVVALWVFSLSLTLGAALDLRTTHATGDLVGAPGDRMVAALQGERTAAQQYLASGRRDPTAFTKSRGAADAAIATFRNLSATYTVKSIGADLTRQRVRETLASLDTLAPLRSTIERGTVDRGAALAGYSDIINVAFSVLYAGDRYADSNVERQTHTLVSISHARELLTQEDALLTGVTTAGRFTAAEQQRLAQIVGASRFQFTTAAQGLPLDIQARYRQLLDGPQFRALRSVEDLAVGHDAGSTAAPFPLGTWQSAFGQVNGTLRGFLVSLFEANSAAGHASGTTTLTRLWLAGGIGLMAIVLSLLISVRTARSVTRRLTRLHRAATELADQRLPAVVRRLRRGEPVDLEAETPQLPLGLDEVGQVGEAFTKVQRTAIASAIDEATLRQGISEVFLNIARRSQSLLHRQLNLLDEMERDTTDPKELRNLFRADHLATRMRRHAEDLVILAGAAPARGWRRPIAFVDVIRGAVSEVEDYQRVKLHPVPDAALTGRAVADIIHLLAELVENATSFSPPDAEVRISGVLVPHGFAVEIEDRGLGMDAEAIEAANAQLADPPEFDPQNSARLGLFVVAQLAARNGVRVTLRTSPYGGVTAVVLIPNDLVDQPTRVGAWTPPSSSSGAGIGPRHALQSHADFEWLDARGAIAAGATPHNGSVMDGSTDGVAATADPHEESPGAVPTELPTAGGPPAHAMGASGSPAPVDAAGASWLGPSVPNDMVARDVWTAGAAEAVDRTDAPALATARSSGPDAPAGRPELPRRVRQPSLATQLQATMPEPPPTIAESRPNRTPEQLRQMMSSYQTGVRRGRLIESSGGPTPGADAVPPQNAQTDGGNA